MSENQSKLAHTPRNVRRKYWLDENGLLEDYFQVGKNLISTKKDYMVVLDKYAESGLAARTFCQKYGIINVLGFEKALERRCLEEPEFEEKVTASLKRTAKQTIAAVIPVVQNTLKDKNYNALGEAIRNGDLEGINFAKFLSVCEKLDKGGTKLVDAMTKLVTRYYYDRLNSYKGTNSKNDLQNLLTNNEVAFISPNGEEKIHQRKAFGIDTNPVEFFIRKVTDLRTIDPKLYSLCVVGKNPTTIESRLTKYKHKFDIDEFLKTRNEYLIDGKVSEVTADDVYLAVAFAELNNIYQGGGAIREIIRSVKMGKVKPTKLLVAKVEDMIKEKSKPRPDFESVNEFFD